MDNLVKITFLGDLMCQMQQVAAIRKIGCGWNVIFDEVKHLWADSDYVVANLETPVTGRGFRSVFEEMRFNAPVEFLQAVKDAGIDFVTTANNHILDRGPKGLDATLCRLDEIGLATTGAYRTESASKDVCVKSIGGLRFGFVACTYDTNSGRKADMLEESNLWKVDYVHHPSRFLGTIGFAIKRTLKELLPYDFKQRLKQWQNGGEIRWANPQNDSFPVEDFDKDVHRRFLNRICDKIKRGKELVDVVIALPHIGGQYNVNPGPWQMQITDALVEAGADLVISNHAHTPLTCEMRNGVLVAHALGNLCFMPRVGFYNDKCQADYSIGLNCYFDLRVRALVKQSFFVMKSIVRNDGVAVVTPVPSDDIEMTEICRRVCSDGNFPMKELLTHEGDR